MGNRAVIATENRDIAVYIHWHGGRDSVRAFLTYCLMQNYRCPEEDCYGWARLCQVLANFFTSDRPYNKGLSVGIDTYERLKDSADWDNGVYIIKGWRIVDREECPDEEQNTHSLIDILNMIDSEMPERDRLGEDAILKWLADNQPVE